jgi:hypothetical protein
MPPAIPGIRLITMKFPPRFHRLRAMGAIFLIAAWAVNPSLYLLNSLLGQLGETSLVQANAIDAPDQAIEACSHHPHGCPKDCFCPKITLQPDSSQNPTAVSGTLYEPSLEQCSEERAAIDSPPVSTAFLPPVNEMPIPSDRIGLFPIPTQPALLDTPREPPQKIPIS